MKLIIFLLTIGIPLLIWGAIQYAIIRWNMYRYPRRLENIYVRSKDPNDKDVRARAEQHRTWLERCGNPYQVEVVVCLFRDKDHPLETWEEYEAREVEERKADMIQRGNYIEAEYGRETYLRLIHGQGGRDRDFLDRLNNLKSTLYDTRISAKRHAAAASSFWKHFSRSHQ